MRDIGTPGRVRDFGGGRRRLGHHRRLLEHRDATASTRPPRHARRSWQRWTQAIIPTVRPSRPPMWIVKRGATDSLWNAADLHLEDGTVAARRALAATGPAARLPRALPRDGWPPTRGWWSLPRRAIPWGSGCGAGRCSCTRPARARSWGIGDLDDLARPRDAGRRRWAPEMLVLNPLHAAAPGIPSSPARTSRPAGCGGTRSRCTSSRCPVRPLLGDELNRFAERGTRARRTQVDRPRRRAPSQARRPRPALLVVDRSRGTGQSRRVQRVLRRARHRPCACSPTCCALAERHGGGWQAWPPELPLPDVGSCRTLRP